MKVIIVPTDFSATSLNAARYAADMACAAQASLALLHVCNLPLGYTEVPLPADAIQAQTDHAMAEIAALKENITVRTQGKVKIYTEVRMGTVITELLKYCSALQPYAVIMGPHGAGAAERLFFGSTTLSAVRNLGWPLIIVPPAIEFTGIKRIGLACDLKKVEETAPIEEIKKLVTGFGATLYVVHVNIEGKNVYGASTVEQSGLLQELLEELHPSYHFLNDAEVARGICEFAEKNRLDLMIAVPKKHNLLEKLFHKSRTKELALCTHVPLMAIHE